MTFVSLLGPIVVVPWTKRELIVTPPDVGLSLAIRRRLSVAEVRAANPFAYSVASKTRRPLAPAVMKPKLPAVVEAPVALGVRSPIANGTIEMFLEPAAP